MDHCTRDGLVFDVRDDGPAGGEAVVLLHGWPQDHTAWRRVTPLLHAAGLRTLAPDQRGYSRGARPSRPTAYGMRELVADVVALLDQAGVDRAHLVGHDWGGSVAWAVAERHPERLRSLTVLSTPHHRAMALGRAARRPGTAQPLHAWRSSCPCSPSWSSMRGSPWCSGAAACLPRTCTGMPRGSASRAPRLRG